MDKPDTNLQAILDEISAENRKLLTLQRARDVEILALRRALSEMTIDVDMQSEGLKELTEKTHRASADLSSSVQASGIPEFIAKAEIAERLAKAAKEAAASLAAYLVYIKTTPVASH